MISQPPATSTRRDTAVALLRRHLRLLAVVLFLVVLAAWFELSGLTEHFDLAFMRQTILRHEAGGLVLFVLLFSLGNLVQIRDVIAEDLEGAFAGKQETQSALDDAVKRGNGLLRQFERNTQQ